MSAYRTRKAANRGSGDFGRFPFLDNSSDRKLLGRLPSVQCKMSAPGQFQKSAPANAMSAFPPLATGRRTSLEVRFVPTADMVVLFRHLENRGMRPVVQSKFGYRWPAVHPFTCAGVKIGFDQRFASLLYSAIARCRSSYSSQGMRQICSRAARCSLAFARSPWAKWASPRCSCALRCRGLRVRAC